MSGEAGNPHTGLEIGRTLELTREKQGLSLQQVEEATKIRTRYLRDLENENFDVLPAVYMLGSLKTYAEHLGLDGAAMTTELKRRQASLHEEQDLARENPSSNEPRGLLASLGNLLGIGETVEDEAGTMSDPVHSPGLYVSLAVVLIFVLATYLASSLEGEGRPVVSQVREPRISQSHSGVALIGNVEGHERSNTEVETNVTQPKEQPKVPANDEVRVEGSRLVKDAPQAVQASSSPTASASIPGSASASASTASAASAPATARPSPVVGRPEPVAKKEPAGGGRKIAAAPAGPPAPPARADNPRIRKTQVISIGATRHNIRIPNNVKKAINSTW